MCIIPIFGKKSDKSSEDELFQKGAAAYNANQWGKASEYLRALVNRNPQHTSARGMLLAALMQEQKADEALEHARYLIKEDPQNAHYHASVGVCLQLKGNNDEAIQAFHRSLELQENPMIRGMACFLKTPDIPTIRIESVDKSMSSIFARVLTKLGDSPVTEEILDKDSISKLSEIGSKAQDDIMAAKDHSKFLKEIADACIENNAYVKVEDLLKKFDTIDQLNGHLQQLEAETGIKGRFAKLEHFDFVQFEKA